MLAWVVPTQFRVAENAKRSVTVNSVEFKCICNTSQTVLLVQLECKTCRTDCAEAAEAVGKVHNKAKIQPAVRIDIRAFPKPKRQEEVCKDVANVMSPFVLANTMLPARTTMEEATFLLMPMSGE